MKKITCLFLLFFAVLTGTAFSQGKSTRNKKTKKIEYGTASIYHSKFNGRRTASGERFDQKKMTAAHNSLPFGTWIKVTNLRNKKSVVVRVNDRLHHTNKRKVDLSRAAYNALGASKGLLKVKVEVLGKKRPTAQSK